MSSGFAASYMTSATPPVPIGGMLQTGSATLPSGFLWADGVAISRTTFANLFDAIGTAFGAGDGVTTFNKPDGRSRNFVGPDSGAGRIAANNTRGATAGTETVTLDTTMIPAHLHPVTDPGHAHVEQGRAAGAATASIQASGGLNTVGGVVAADVSTASATTGITTNNTGGGLAHSNLQPYQVSGGWIIRFI